MKEFDDLSVLAVSVRISADAGGAVAQSGSGGNCGNSGSSSNGGGGGGCHFLSPS